MNRVKGAKEQQSLYLSEATIAGLRGIADQMGESVSQVADDFLAAQIDRYRTNAVIMGQINVIEQNLPPSLAGVDESHPIFGRQRPPSKVLVRARSSDAN